MKIICIGRNYVEHIKELNSAMPTAPVFFLKPDTALLTRNRPFFYPGFTREIHHEVELVLKIGKVGKAIQKNSRTLITMRSASGSTLPRATSRTTQKRKGFPGRFPRDLTTPLP